MSKTEEDSPRKVEIHTARQARVAGRGLSLNEELNQMSSKSAEAKQLRDKFFTAYRACAAHVSNHDVLVGDTASVCGSVHNKLTGGGAVDLPIVWDSGCSKDIISEDIVRALRVTVQRA